MELQVEKYQDLIKSLSSKLSSENGYYSKEDLEQELWLKLYDFIKLHSGESDNFPLIKSALRFHLFDLIRNNARRGNITDSIETLILRGVDLVSTGFGPCEEVESKEILSLINEWFKKQNAITKEFFERCMMEDGKIKFHKIKKIMGINNHKCYEIINLLKKYMEKKGVAYVSSKSKNRS